MLALGASAETYYLLGQDPGSTSSMTGVGSCAGWGSSVGGSQSAMKVEAGNTYILPSDTSVRTPNNSGSGFTFVGDQLIFEGGSVNLKHGGTNSGTYDFQVTNLLVRSCTETSQISCGNWKVTYNLIGDNWVIESGATLGLGLSSDTTDIRAFNIQSTIKGAGALRLFTNTDLTIKGACNFTLSGDLSGFTGDIDIDGCYKTAITVSGDRAFGSDPQTGTSRITIDGVKNNNNTGGITLTFNTDYTFGLNRSWKFGLVDGATMPTISVASSKTVTISGPIGGLAGLKKTGDGTLVFAHPAFRDNPPTFTGTKTISPAELSDYAAQIESWTKQFSLSGGTVTPDVDSADVSVKVDKVGGDSDPVQVSVIWGMSSDALVNTNLIESAAVAGQVCNGTIDGLSSGTTYYYAFTATDGLGEFVTTTPSRFRTLRDPSDQIYSWREGTASGDWDDPKNWTGGVVPVTGAVVCVSGTATITRGSETARITDAELKVNADETLTLVSGTIVPYPTLDLTQPVAGRPLTVETGTFGGITGGVFSVQWNRGKAMTSKSYAKLSTETSFTPTADDYEYFFQCVVKGSGGTQLYQKEFYFSRLPVLYMTTDDGQTPTTMKESHAGRVFVQGNDSWECPYDGAMTIKMRGNTTTGSTYRKKPWKLKFDSKAEMFGIAKSKHWVLLANDKEKSAMRNKLAYDLANEIGSLGLESTWVECFLNGTYQGLYLFAEQIRVAKARVNIFDWESAGEDAADAIAEANAFTDEDTAALEKQMTENLAWVTSGKVSFNSREYAVTDDFRNLDTSGGFLFESSKEMDEASRFSITSGTLTFEAMLNSPEFLKTNSAMFNDCMTRVQDYLAALASPDGYNANGVSWVQLADVDAMATYLLAIELFGNDDAEKKSRYFYWDVGGPIKFGPVWDFDWGVGNTLVDKTIGNPESWRAHNNNPRSFFREWTDDPWFCTRLRTLYWSRARDVLARMISDGGEIDRYHDYLAEAAAANEVKWPNKADSGEARSFETDVTNLCTFLTTRLAWLDAQFADVPTLMESFKRSCYKAHSSRPDLDDLPSNCPYTADTERLQISFPNAPQNSIARGTALEMSATVASNTVESVDVYVNGLKVGESLVPASGSVSAEIPAVALTEAPGDDNCVALVARDTSGNVVSRNYRLVKTFSEESVDDGYTFVFHGEYSGDQTISPTGAECVVVFDEASIDGRLMLPDGVKVYLCPTNGTENTVKGIVGPGSNLTFKDFDGLGGKVSLEGADTLVSVSNLVVKSGVLDITSTGVAKTKTPIVNVLGHVKQDGGIINLCMGEVADPLQAYGIYVANKDPENAKGKNMGIVYAEFNGGEFNATVGGWKSAALYINKGSVEATFNDGCTNVVSLVGPEARFVNASGDLNLKGGEFTVLMPDDDCSSLTNARVFKSDKEIKIKGGHYVVNVPGPGSEIFSVSKDKKDSVITVTDGTFELVSDDDCFSADDRIDIQGGLFYAVSLGNDIFDSNGDMLISGGTIMAYATAEGHEAFDVEPVVQGKEVSSFLPHRLTISGGTIFATGGKNAEWPTNIAVKTGLNVFKVADADKNTYSGKYLSLSGSGSVTYTAKLPESGVRAVIATCSGFSGTPSISDDAPASGDQGFHGLYINTTAETNQEHLRIYEIYGSTNDEAGGDTGEYIVLTNVSDKVVQLSGLVVTSAKYDKKKDKIDDPKVNVALTSGMVGAGASIKLKQPDFTGDGWEKITNGTIYFQIINDVGTVVQSGFGAFDNELFPKTDGEGAAIRAKRFDNDKPLAATTEDWESTCKAEATTVSPGAPLGPYDTEEEATEAFGRAVFAPSAEVVAKLGAGSEALAAYSNKFSLGVFAVADGKWSVEACLLPEQWTNVVLSVQEATRQLPVARLARQDDRTPLENVLLTNCVPGFYYSLYDGPSMTNLRADVKAENGNILCGPDQKVVVPVLSKPSPAAGFFSIGVLETPSVNPGESEIVKPQPIVIPVLQ